MTWRRLSFYRSKLTLKIISVVCIFSGIGLEVSKCLASRGCRVIVACRTSSNKLSKYLLQETSNSNMVVKHLDLKSFPSVRKFANDILKTENKIDILVNNAEVLFDLSPLIEDDEVDSLLQTNIVSSFLLTHLLIGWSSKLYLQQDLIKSELQIYWRSLMTQE